MEARSRMTMVNWFLGPDGVAVLTDTVCCSLEYNGPFLLMDKARAVQRMGVIVTGGGDSRFLRQAFAHVSDVSLATDVGSLREELPTVLRMLGQWLHPITLEPAQLSPEGLSYIPNKIAAFGWSEPHDRFVGFHCRSRDDYAAESIPDGLSCMPPPENPPELDAMTLGPADLLPMAMLQKAEDDARPAGRRYFLGGELLVHEAIRSNGQVQLRSQRVHRFPEFEEWRQSCLMRGVGKLGGA